MLLPFMEELINSHTYFAGAEQGIYHREIEVSTVCPPLSKANLFVLNEEQH